VGIASPPQSAAGGVSLIGASTDIGEGTMGARMGPEALRVAGIAGAVARHCRENGKKLRVLWFDAHADFNTETLTPSGNIHGMPVACLCGHGPRELIEIGGHVPALNPKDIRQIGIRTLMRADTARR
jgi:arginase